jgi:uncharacterized protein (TIGR04255 family)
MSKLPKAPLLEVIFELKWDITNKNDVIDFQYLHGDLYSNLKNKFLYRENLIPPEIPFDVLIGTPVYRFRRNQNEYPLIQIGPGLITVNTIDCIYFWEDFKKEVENTFNSLQLVYPKSKKIIFTPILTYIDFFEIDFQKQTILEFINKNLNLNIQQNFMDNKKSSFNDINLTLNYNIDSNILSLNLTNGNLNNSKSGIILQTKIIGEKNIYSTFKITEWLNEVHKISSELFKKITEGKLYSSFL